MFATFRPFIIAVGSLPGIAVAADPPHYTATFDAQTHQVEVRACLSQEHAHVQFAADSGWAMRFVHDVRRTDRPVRTDGDGWSADQWRAGECLSYRADLGAIADEHKPDVGWRMGDDLMAAPQLWLLRPDVQNDADAEIDVVLPSGWSISAPWRQIDRNRFRIPNTPSDWSSAVAIGKFGEERIDLPGGFLRLTILQGADAEQRKKLHDWLAHVSRAVLSAYGRLPLPEVQVLMIPVDRGENGVLFGQSIRGQGNALELLVSPARPASEFADDWMAVHELSHLMHPYLGDRGSWLAEGLATYYQNVLRGRSGMLTVAQAWDRLAEGFRRGATASVRTSDTLDQTAQNMHRSHAFQRVYWAGAAYWLTVDRDLRRDSGGKLDLETALSRFRDCCLPAYREWKPEEFVGKLDALAGTETFTKRWREFSQMTHFPEWEKLYADLGVRENGERVDFDDKAPDAAVRAAIISPRAPQTR